MRLAHLCLLLVFSVSASPGSAATPTSDAPRPWPHGGMVAAANPYAVQAGVRVLQAGGHAVDAAIAAHAVLGLVEPQSSGVGGGAFMLVYDAASRQVLAYDGRETAPAGASADMFVVDGEPLGYLDAWQSGLSVGVPGVPALYADSHARHGRLDLADVLEPAITLARDGFEVSPRLAGFLARIRQVSRLDDNPDTADYFYPDGEPLPVGFRRTNPAYARTLARLAEAGPESFYRGGLAEQIVAAARAEPHPGRLTLDDLRRYRSVRREALCGPAGAEVVCTMPPPSSGVAQLMIVNLYDRFAATAGSDADRWAAFVDAQRLAYADRDRYVGDADFADVPVAELVDPAYLDARAAERVAPAAAPKPGDPGAVLRNQPMLVQRAPDSTRTMPGTTHVSVIDGDGNAVSLTASVEAPFGSSRWAGGFLLNNQLTDFARDPGRPGAAAVNIALPGKRPRSSMSPTMVFDADGGLRMVTGSPGGNSIVAYVAKTLVGVLRWGLSAQQAVEAPNVVARGRDVRVETGVEGGQALADALTARGYPVQEREGENSGLHVIVVADDGLDGAADPRREGQAVAVEAAKAAQIENRGSGTGRWWDALPRPIWSEFERIAPEVPWYEIYRIRPGIFAIYEPGQFEEVISYLIVGAARALLFDTGLGIGDMRGAVRAVTDLPVSVLNSHSHYDHIGGNGLFDRIHALDTDYTRQRALHGLPHEDVAEAVSEGWIWQPLPPAFDRTGYRIEPYDIDGFVNEGFEFDLGGRTLEVLVTPGHAPDSVCLLDRANRLLFTGDTFYPAPLYTHIPGADFESYRTSARRLAGLEPLVDHLLPGHNEPWVPSDYLVRMSRAFEQIARDEADYVVNDGLREYRFDGFGVLAADPPAPR